MKSQIRKWLRRSKPRTAPDLTFADYVAERVGIWAVAPPVVGAVVFLGDSQIERGRWNEWWTKTPILNRGIGGECIAGVHARLNEMVRHEPRLVVIECGTNDLAQGATAARAARDFEALLVALREQLPTCVLWVQGVLPAHSVQWRELTPVESSARALALNARIRDLNRQLEAVARKHGTPFLDLHSFLEENGALRAECTLDGVHLNGTGYWVWREAIDSHAPPEVAAILSGGR